ncbi:uncharacterized protein LOC144452450 isoform X2 [Glandiceps talaboti]
MPRLTKKTRVITRDDDIEIEKDVANLSDRELAEELRQLGVSVGPILDSTRSVYERKLVRLRTEGPQEPKVNNESDQYSDSDEDVSSKESSQESEVSNTQIKLRKRTTQQTKHTTRIHGTRQQDSGDSRDSPKKQVTMTTTTTRQVTKTQNATQDTLEVTKTKPAEPKKRLVPVYVQILILLAVAIFIFFVLYNMEKLPQRKIPESLSGSEDMPSITAE